MGQGGVGACVTGVNVGPGTVGRCVGGRVRGTRVGRAVSPVGCEDTEGKSVGGAEVDGAAEIVGTVGSPEGESETIKNGD